MSKQAGLLKVRGQLEDLVFRKSKNGHIVYKAPEPVAKAKRETGDSFERWRENRAEFNRSFSAAKLVRQSLVTDITKLADNGLSPRLYKELLKVIFSDPVSKRGERVIMKGKMELMNGFSFNLNADIQSVFKANYTSTIDRASGKLDLNVPAFIPKGTVSSPVGTTHFRLYSIGLEINFETGHFVRNKVESANIPVGSKTETAAFSLLNLMMAASTNPLFILIGISYSQEVNGDFYPLNDSSYAALEIINAASV